MRGARGNLLAGALLAALLAVAGCEGAPSQPDDVAEPEPTPAPSPTDPDEAARGQGERSAGDQRDAPEGPQPPAAGHDEAGPGEGAYGVSAGHPVAVDVGMQVLEEGGNAVDAAVATAYAVSVVEPFASGVGGGGAALVLEPGSEPLAYDYREVVAENGQVPDSEIGIPGFVAGMQRLHDAHGSTDLDRLLEPAITLAAEGVETSDIVAERLRAAAHRLPVAELDHLFPDGRALSPGEPLVQDELADLLQRLADDGAETFYEGAVADELSTRVDGIDPESLSAYEVAHPEPATGALADLEIVAAAPPLAGATLIQILQIAEAHGIADMEPGSADFVHTLGMAWRVAEHLRVTELGDPAFVDVPVARLTDPQRNAELAEHIPADGLVSVDDLRGAEAGDPNTTHVTVVDPDGRLVSMTNTLLNFWGSGQHELGFFLNNHLTRFDDRDGSPNGPEPGKRPATYALPAIVTDAQGRAVLGIGTPGGRRIPLVLAQVLVRWGLHAQELAEAVEAPRFHLEDAVLEMEERPPGDVADELLGRGYQDIRGPPAALYYGSVQVLEIDHDREELWGAADPRREGDWRVESP